MKILVTGANGYIGTGVVKALLSLNQEVIATDFSVDGIDSRAKAIAGNIFEIDNPYEYFGKPARRGRLPLFLSVRPHIQLMAV